MTLWSGVILRNAHPIFNPAAVLFVMAGFNSSGSFQGMQALANAVRAKPDSGRRKHPKNGHVPILTVLYQPFDSFAILILQWLAYRFFPALHWCSLRLLHEMKKVGIA